jgi:hypothetical protein
MAEQQVSGSAGEMMVFGLIEQADRIGKSALATQQDLAEQIEHLGQVQEWAVNAAVELQKQAATAIKNLEAERAQLQASRTGLERNAVQAIQNAVRQQSAEIERHTTQALAVPLHDIGQAAAQVRQNIKETSWLVTGLILALGIVLGLVLGWLPFRSSLNHLQEQEDRIEQYLATQQQQAAPVTPEPSHAPAHKGKK